MPSLDKATDLGLLKCGLISIDKIERDGSMLRPMACMTMDPERGLIYQHDWSKTQYDIAHEPPYQFCRDCGSLRRSPWGK